MISNLNQMQFSDREKTRKISQHCNYFQ